MISVLVSQLKSKTFPAEVHVILEKCHPELVSWTTPLHQISQGKSPPLPFALGKVCDWARPALLGAPPPHSGPLGFPTLTPQRWGHRQAHTQALGSRAHSDTHTVSLQAQLTPGGTGHKPSVTAAPLAEAEQHPQPENPNPHTLTKSVSVTPARILTCWCT